MQALQFNVTTASFIIAKCAGYVLGKRVFYKGPLRTIRLVDIPEPTLPATDWVKIKTLYCGFCGSDQNLILLHDSPSASPFTSFPSVLGHEIVGEIVETGADVKDFSAGDIVTIYPFLGCAARKIQPLCSSCQAGKSSSCENFAKGSLPPGMLTGLNSGINGGFAPFLVAHASQLFKVPASVSPEEAVMTEPVTVALGTLFDNLPQPDEKVLVVGGGVIGTLLIRAIRALVENCQISVIEPSEFAAALALESGADEIIPINDIYTGAARVTGATLYKPLIGVTMPMGGFERIYDTVGNSATLNQNLRLLKALGTLSVVGIGGDVKLDLTPLWLKLQTIKGVYGCGEITYQGRKQHAFTAALELMGSGKIHTADLITHKFNIAQYADMIAVNLNKGEHKAVKTVVSFI